MYEFYTSTSGQSFVVKRSDDCTICIPFDPNNRDYAEYLRWLEEGNEPLPADLPED